MSSESRWAWIGSERSLQDAELSQLKALDVSAERLGGGVLLRLDTTLQALGELMQRCVHLAGELGLVVGVGERPDQARNLALAGTDVQAGRVVWVFQDRDWELAPGEERTVGGRLLLFPTAQRRPVPVPVPSRQLSLFAGAA